MKFPFFFSKGYLMQEFPKKKCEYQSWSYTRAIYYKVVWKWEWYLKETYWIDFQVFIVLCWCHSPNWVLLPIDSKIKFYISHCILLVRIQKLSLLNKFVTKVSMKWTINWYECSLTDIIVTSAANKTNCYPISVFGI